MRRWEYMIMDFSALEPNGLDIGNREAQLDLEGEGGWELVAIAGNLAYLRHELQEGETAS